MGNGGIPPLRGHVRKRKGLFKITHYFGNSEMTQVEVIDENNPPLLECHTPSGAFRAE